MSVAESITEQCPDRYKLLTLVGRGGMAVVHAALERSPTGASRLVALKRLQPRFQSDHVLRNMFRDEGRIALRLHHPNIVQTYEVGVCGNVDYIAMEYLSGQPLSRLARSPRPLGQRLAARLVSETLNGLHYAHQLRDFDGTALEIVHRDCSPQNVFLTYDGVVKLVDFGVAKAALSCGPATRVGTIKGKLAYLAPEQANSKPLDGRADVFTIGIVLWELLSGKRLIGQCAPSLALKRLLHDPFPQLETVRQDIDPGLASIAHRALERDPERRWQSALEMRDALEDYLSNSGPALRNEDVANELQSRFGPQRARQLARLNSCLRNLNDEAPHRAEIQMPAYRVVQLVSNETRSMGGGMGTTLPVTPPAPEWKSDHVSIEFEAREPSGSRRLSKPSTSSPSTPAASPPVGNSAIHMDVTQLDQALVRQKQRRQRYQRVFIWSAIGLMTWGGAWALGQFTADRLGQESTQASPSPARERGTGATDTLDVAVPARAEVIEAAAENPPERRERTDNAPPPTRDGTTSVATARTARRVAPPMTTPSPKVRRPSKPVLSPTSESAAERRGALPTKTRDAPEKDTSITAANAPRKAPLPSPDKERSPATLLPPPPRVPLLE